MKCAWQWWLLAMCAAPGCMTLPAINGPEQKPAPVVVPAKPKPPVTADKITSTNAHQTATALWDELDLAAQDSEQPPK
ncbi:MAG: hypothetical protein K2R98_08755 [Gemmataceae bacterium]|nr:hypothetical protein [Gemmataceae bacterium]